ncbi:MAG: hypothetical protein FWG10_05540 [Eubacteriaceae bacterium]|nr:hypothetical protein [Eubacteriaceae bacterium]
MDKYIYDAKKTQAAYGKTLSGPRESFSPTGEERKTIEGKIARCRGRGGLVAR